MGHHCAAFGCSNDSRKLSCKERKISFHVFPLNEPERLQKWLMNLRRKDFVPNNHTVICSEHFGEEDFVYKMFAGTRMLKKNAIPTRFCFNTVANNNGLNMEGRIKTQIQGKGFKAFIGKTEKKCNKCGFVTFCLHVLYKHKYKCRGQLLGKPTFCSYCKRKFYFLTLYRTHKLRCVKKIERKKFLSSKLKEKHLRYKRKSKQTSANKYSFSCPICHASFKSKFKFVSHLKEQSCTSQQTRKKISFSARKSCNSVKSSKISRLYENKPNSISKNEKDFYKSNNNKQFCCTWCKSLYPSEKLFFMHLGMNEKCAIIYYETLSSNIHKKASLKAKKTLHVVARKSFSHKKEHIIKDFSRKKVFSNRSARKSLTTSHRKGYGKIHVDVPKSFLNQCPVCYKDFSDTFTFFQHQKLMNHWGKATKSFNSSYKCPFCGKEFLHLKSRNAHVRSHTDRSDSEIKSFLKSCVCKICSQVFASAVATQQHMKIEHHTQTSHYSIKKFGSGSEHNTTSDNEYISKNKMSSVPSSVKKKLKQQPNSCPVCSKTFSHTVLRNKHFNEVHLKIFECQYCNTKFKSTSSLFNHIQQSHGKNLECKECKSNFVNELQLLQHVLKLHPNCDPKLLLPLKSLKNTILKEKPQDITSEIGGVEYIDKIPFINDASKKNLEYYCDVCDIGYQKLCGLQRHRQSKFHKDTLEKNLDAFQKSLSELPPSTPSYPRVVKQPEILTCSECSEDFTNIKDFVPHRLSHFSVQSKYLKINELNPYMCEICSDVLDSHSKVQLHLFWHLQIESTSNKNTNAVSNKSDTIVPDRLSGQHVAKKSFTKPSSEPLQEVIIGGVKKPLFTCEACNIGFTTKAHYNMHVRKLCTKIKTSKQFSKNSNSEHESLKKSLDNSKSTMAYCNNCNCLFASPVKYEQHKEFCVKCYFDDSSEEIQSNSDIIKSALNLNTGIAGCITCAAIFENLASVAGHLTIHQGDISLSDAVMEEVLHCALCNCLFTLEAFKLHKDFCKIPVNFGSKITYEKHINVLKSALELKCAIAACISCGVPFDDLETFSKHLTLHQTNQIQNESTDKTLCNGETIDSTFNVESENSFVDNTSNFLIGDLTNSVESNNQEGNLLSSSVKSLDIIQDYTSNSVVETEANTSILIDSRENDEVEDINNLRKNFSELLCILISDPELMQKLGFGEQLVDNVLINVLQQMGQTPCTEKVSDIDLLRKNIQIFLDLCLKDQVMQVIGKGKTTDEMVVEALKIFTSDDSTINDES